MVNQSPEKEKTILRHRPAIYLVSACLMGLQTRYDGRLKPCGACRTFLRDAVWIPVCPEQLGGLATPRCAADIVGGDGDDVLAAKAGVFTRDGEDVTRQFLLGAHQVLAIAAAQPVTAVLLKADSPSCGVEPRVGVTAALLRQNGFPLRQY
jgi:uncharacterized protein YbbK (DUF523 family)